MGPKDLPSERLRQDAGAAHLHSSPSRFMSGPPRSRAKRFLRPSCGSGAGFRCLAGVQTSENCRLIPAHARKYIGFATARLFFAKTCNGVMLLGCMQGKGNSTSTSRLLILVVVTTIISITASKIIEQISDTFGIASWSRVGGVFSNIQEMSARRARQTSSAAEVGVQGHARRKLPCIPSHQAAAAALRRQGQG